MKSFPNNEIGRSGFLMAVYLYPCGTGLEEIQYGLQTAVAHPV
jgi:hypothetical protein